MKLFIFNKKYFIITILFFITLFSFSSYFSYKYIINREYILEQNFDDIPFNENIDYNNSIIDENDELIERKELLLNKYNNKKLIALTFDDGPSKYTKILIDELKKREIPVTFFILGENAIKYPDTIKFAFDTGNEIGIHSYEHKLFTKLTEEQIIDEINKTKNVIKEYIDSPITLIRVPYGSRNEKVDNVLEKLNLTDILWTVDSKDWKLKNTKKVYNYVLKYIKGNDIILMHDTFKTSIEAATKIIDFLTDKGYVFVTVSELLELKEDT